jgi:hypothetical protein
LPQLPLAQNLYEILGYAAGLGVVLLIKSYDATRMSGATNPGPIVLVAGVPAGDKAPPGATERRDTIAFLE